MTKRDLLPDNEAEARAKEIVRRLRFRGPHFLISAATGRGTKELAQAVMGFLEEQAREALAREAPAGDTAA
jgi:GTP-binding protein